MPSDVNTIPYRASPWRDEGIVSGIGSGGRWPRCGDIQLLTTCLSDVDLGHARREQAAHTRQGHDGVEIALPSK